MIQKRREQEQQEEEEEAQGGAAKSRVNVKNNVLIELPESPPMSSADDSSDEEREDGHNNNDNNNYNNNNNNNDNNYNEDEDEDETHDKDENDNGDDGEKEQEKSETENDLSLLKDEDQGLQQEEKDGPQGQQRGQFIIRTEQEESSMMKDTKHELQQHHEKERLPVVAKFQSKGYSVKDKDKESPILSTEMDPDGLQQKLARAWNATQCVWDAKTLMPPKLHELRYEQHQPLIPRNGPKYGILLDTARHYFPLEWLYGFIDFCSVLGYQWIHFRLTDDQAFVVKLDSHPELVQSVSPYHPEEYYTAQELRDLVHYASEHNVTLIPELNVPSHAAGWSGIPGLLCPCVDFICSHSYAIPIDVGRAGPQLITILEHIIGEILSIFSTTPYLHLGGDELWMSEACFDELQYKPNYQDFETQLAIMLETKLKYNLSNVIRWERTNNGEKVPGTGNRDLNRIISGKRDQEPPMIRAGTMTHWWSSLPTQESELHTPFIISTDLYFDASLDRDAHDIYNITLQRQGLQPTAVVAATFELSPCTWNVRNVWGKLIAVAMAAADASPGDENDHRDHEIMPHIGERLSFLQHYHDTCLQLLGEDDGSTSSSTTSTNATNSICALEGRPAIPTHTWMTTHHLKLKEAWGANICHRLTEPSAHKMTMRLSSSTGTPDPGLDTYAMLAVERAKIFKGAIERIQSSSTRFQKKQDDTILYQHVYNHTGVMVDLAHHYFPMESLQHLIDIISQLGFNLLHLRLVENEFFPVTLLEYTNLASPVKGAPRTYSERDLTSLVEYAAERGVRVMPEINFFSNAGGWEKSSLLVACPHYICQTGGSIPVDLNKSKALSMLSIVCGTLLQIFYTSPFLHLGSIDPETVEPCYREAYPRGTFNLQQTFANFQKALNAILDTMGVSKDRIVQWESSSSSISINDEKNASTTTILGQITHYQQSTPVPGTTSGPFLMSADTSLDAIGDDSAWEMYQHTRMSYNVDAMGVIVGTSGMDVTAWESQNVMGRLIAIAAGLSNNNNKNAMDQQTFEAHFQETCQTLKLPDAVCTSLGKPISSTAADWELKRDALEADLRTHKCKAFTSAGVWRLPRESVFGELNEKE